MIQLTVPMIDDCDLLGAVWQYRRSFDRWQVLSFFTADQAVSDDNSVLEPVHRSRSGVVHGKAAPAFKATPPARISNPHSA